MATTPEFWNCPECGGTAVKDYPEQTYRRMDTIVFQRGCLEPTCDAIWVERSRLFAPEITVTAEGRFKEVRV